MLLYWPVMRHRESFVKGVKKRIEGNTKYYLKNCRTRKKKERKYSNLNINYYRRPIFLYF